MNISEAAGSGRRALAVSAVLVCACVAAALFLASVYS